MAQKKQANKKNQKASKTKQVLLIIVSILLILLLSVVLPPLYEPNEQPTPTETVVDTPLHIPTYTTAEAEYITHHTGFTVSFNPEHQIPNWVGYELTGEETRGKVKRSNFFIPDPTLECCKAQTFDYSRSGYDRGHMAPAGDMRWDKRAMDECFFLSNICPQHPDLNQKRWNDLEIKIREWAVADSAIIIICGPLIGNKPRKTIGKNKISVPDGFFKVVLSPYRKKPQAIGFLFENKKATDPLHTYVVSVDSIESLTGRDFFSGLPDSIENIIEAQTDLTYWGI